jgi:predicted ATP-grasp superfamily ATP-dependent carboligase
MLDSRIAAFDPPLKVDATTVVSKPREALSTLARLAKEADYSCIIAPEAEGVLEKVINATKGGGVSMNCPSRTVRRVANKRVLFEELESAGFRVPKTSAVSVEDVEQAISTAKEIGFPVAVKPSDGVGCSGLSIVKSDEDVSMALQKIAKLRIDTALFQEFIHGIPASVSLISTDEKALPISLNKQSILFATPDAESAYLGGSAPFHHPLRREALKIASKVVEHLGLVGYAGVDLVLSKTGPVVIEVNPRLTTSFVGLKLISRPSLAQALIEVAEGKLPEKVKLDGYAMWSKLRVRASQRKFQMVRNLKSVASPPFPLPQELFAYALLAVRSNRPRGAKLRYKEEERRFLRSFGGAMWMPSWTGELI